MSAAQTATRAQRLRRAARRAGLTDRAADVLVLLTDGLTTEAAAEHLRMDPNTARGHLYRARQRVGVTSNEALIAAITLPDDDHERLT